MNNRAVFLVVCTSMTCGNEVQTTVVKVLSTQEKANDWIARQPKYSSVSYDVTEEIVDGED